MVLLFRPVEQLQKLAVSAGIPYSIAQILEFGLTILRNTRDFEQGLSEWNKKSSADQTWPKFKTHFKAAQTELKAIRGPTMQQVGYHHANMLAQQLRSTIDSQGTEMLAMLQDITTNVNPPLEEQPQAPPAPAANAVAHTDIQMEMLRLLQDMRQELSGRAGRGGGGRGNHRFPIYAYTGSKWCTLMLGRWLGVTTVVADWRVDTA
jgi:hypothetical protein